MKAALVALTACGFSPQTGVATDGAPGDGTMPVIDAAVDGPTCHVIPMGAFTIGTGQLGNPLAAAVGMQDLACMSNEVVVGVQFDMTTGAPPGGWNQRVVVATHAQCGTIALSPDGSMHTTKTEVLTSPNAQCMNWSPVVTTMPVSCPDGDVLIAMSGNEATKNGTTHSLFNSISISCAPLDFHGVVTDPPVRVKLTDSGNNTDQSQSTICPTGLAVTGFTIYQACGDDGLKLQCAPTACM
jgi:hypothetical protein